MARTGDTIISLSAARQHRRSAQINALYDRLTEPQQRVFEALVRVRLVSGDVALAPDAMVAATRKILDDLFASF